MGAYETLCTEHDEIKVPLCVRQEVLVLMSLNDHLAKDDFIQAIDCLDMNALSVGFEGYAASTSKLVP